MADTGKVDGLVTQRLEAGVGAGPAGRGSGCGLQDVLPNAGYVSQKGGGDIAGSRADNVPSPSQSLVPTQRGGGVEGPNSHLLNEA